LRKYNETLRKISLGISIIFKPFFRKKNSFLDCAAPKTILVIELHKLGDVVLIIPLLQFLRKKYPKSKIIFLGPTFSEDIMTGQNIYDELVKFDAFWVTKSKFKFIEDLALIYNLIRNLRKKNIDLTIDIRGDFRNILIAHLSNSKSIIGYGSTGGDYLLSNNLDTNSTLQHLSFHIKKVIDFLNSNSEEFYYKPSIKLTNIEIIECKFIEQYIGINYIGSNDLRSLDFNTLEKLLKTILEFNTRVVVFLSPNSGNELNTFIDKFNAKNLCNVEVVSLPLRNYITYLSRAVYLINVDSGPAHLAAALGIPQTTIFGPNEPKIVKPISEKVFIIFNQSLDCRPCNQIHCTNTEYKKCLSDIKLVNIINPKYIL